jgi:hypothetical protein
MSHCRLRDGSDFDYRFGERAVPNGRVAPEVAICILARAVIVLHRAKA